MIRFWTRILVLAMLLTPIILAHAAAIQSVDTLDVIFESNVVDRDSGEDVTRAFLSTCLSKERPTRYRLECDDVLFVYHISYFKRNSDQSIFVLITEDGASVENRWVFEIQKDKYVDVTEDIWPEMTADQMSQLLIQETGNKTYTAGYIRSVAHSSYRVSYGSDETMSVISGIPDASYGVQLGRISWNGHEFVFSPR